MVGGSSPPAGSPGSSGVERGTENPEVSGSNPLPGTSSVRLTIVIFVLNLTSSSRRDLARACRQTSRSLERYFRFSRALAKAGLQRSVIVQSFGYRSPNRWRPLRKRISVIRSPFVYKKTGETFFFSRHRARLAFQVTSSDINVGVLRFMLYLGGGSAAFTNVELRLTTFSSHDPKKLPR